MKTIFSLLMTFITSLIYNSKSM